LKTPFDTSVILAEDQPPSSGDAALSWATHAELHFGIRLARDQDQAALGDLVDVRLVR
jgi:hypothetical protein